MLQAPCGLHATAMESQQAILCLQVLMYVYLPYKHIMRWEYVGKARVHHAPVVGLTFGETPAGQCHCPSAPQ